MDISAHFKPKCGLLSSVRSTRLRPVRYCISESQADELVHKYNVVSPQKASIIHNGYDLSPFGSGENQRQARDLRREFGFDDSHFVVLWAGRLVPIKNVELLAKIVREAKRSPSLRFLVVGDGTDRENWKA